MGGDKEIDQAFETEKFFLVASFTALALLVLFVILAPRVSGYVDWGRRRSLVRFFSLIERNEGLITSFFMGGTMACIAHAVKWAWLVHQMV